jgi:hypothetical protein
MFYVYAVVEAENPGKEHITVRNRPLQADPPGTFGGLKSVTLLGTFDTWPTAESEQQFILQRVAGHDRAI